MLADPNRRRALVAAAAAELGAAPGTLVSAGPEALVLTSMLAGELRLPMAYLRPKPKNHGRQQRVEGELRGSVTLIAGDGDPEAMADYTALVTERGASVGRVVPLPSQPKTRGGDGSGQPEMPPLRRRLPRPPSPANGRGAAAVARGLLDIGAVVIREEPFRYASGLLSPIYTDCRLLISHPAEWQAVLAGLSASLAKATFDLVDGVATSGIPHASVLAYRLDVPLAYVEGGVVRGQPAAGSRAVVVEDLVTTGKSVLEATGTLRAAGVRAERCCAIFTYDRLQPSLDEAGIAFEPLSDLSTLLDVGIAAGCFGPRERDAVLEWRRDPQGWTASHEPA